MALATAVCPGQHDVLPIFPVKDPSSPCSTQTALVSYSQKWPWCPFASSLTYIFLIKRKGGKYLFKLSEPNRNSRTALGPKEATTFLQEDSLRSVGSDNSNNSNKSNGLEVLKCHLLLSHSGLIKAP